jgi:NADH-ubiquinone oxidoreductase chain 6
LIGLFLTISIYLIILGLSFIGLSYLIVYVGAVSILFLFILMLINIRTSEIQNTTQNNVVLSSITSILFAFFFFQLLPYNIITINYEKPILNNILYSMYINILNVFSSKENQNSLYFATGKI